MRSCAACGGHDHLLGVKGWFLCWTCRRIPGVREILDAAMEVWTESGVAVVPYPRLAVGIMITEVRELWLLQTTKR